MKRIITCAFFCCLFIAGYVPQMDQRASNMGLFQPPVHFPTPVYNLALNPVTSEGFQLGRSLFYDPILSDGQMISCADCHQQFAAFAHVDHKLAHGIAGRIGKRNAPALQNLAWKKHFMADGGILDLDAQPIAPITHPNEMNETLPGIIAKLRSHPSYPARFAKVFGDTAVSVKRVMQSLSQFMLMLVSANSLWDKVQLGRETFTETQQSGWRIFQKNCASCHQPPLFSGYGFATNGMLPDTALNDSGRSIITGRRSDAFMFAIPSLRNCEVTFPYMHDGRFGNLNEVVHHYAQVASFSSDPKLKRIKLSETDNIALISFLKTLTDQEFLHNRAFAAPAW